MAADDPVAQWLLHGDPAIRWQVLSDLLDAPESEVVTERGARGLGCSAPGSASS
jgi:hypothetical protein